MDNFRNMYAVIHETGEGKTLAVDVPSPYVLQVIKLDSASCFHYNELDVIFEAQ